MNSVTYENAQIQLRKAMVQTEATGELAQIIAAREQVLTRFQPIFSKEYIPQLRQEEFHAFLLVRSEQIDEFWFCHHQPTSPSPE